MSRLKQFSFELVLMLLVALILGMMVCVQVHGQRDHTPPVSAQQIGQQKLTNRHGGLDEGLGSLARTDLNMQLANAVVEETGRKQGVKRTAFGLENEDKASDHICADCPCHRQHHTRCDKGCQLKPDGKVYRRMSTKEQAGCVLRCIKN